MYNFPEVADFGESTRFDEEAAAENEDGVARKALGGGSWIPVGVGAGLPQEQLDARQAFIPELRKRLPAERKHIAHEGDFFVSGYDEKWPETFQPNAKM